MRLSDYSGTEPQSGEAVAVEKSATEFPASMVWTISAATVTIQAAIIACWMPDELGNICDRARRHCRTVCLHR
jgi:hypothetical protein